MPVQRVPKKSLRWGMNGVLLLSEASMNEGERKGHRYGLGEFNPLNMCMFFLLVWSMFNGVLGFFVGHFSNMASDAWLPPVIWIAFAVCVPLLIAILMFRYFHSYKVVKVEEDRKQAGENASATAKATEAVEEAPEAAKDAAEEPDDEHEEPAPTNRKGWFSARCNDIASHYLLSKRETEVLFLLAKGHNAAFIQEQLCVSRSTAKTHINHIYRKLDIHTQQELLNMVEDGPRGGEDGRVVGSFPGVMQIDNPRKVMEEAIARAAKAPQKNYRKDIFEK